MNNFARGFDVLLPADKGKVITRTLVLISKEFSEVFYIFFSRAEKATGYMVSSNESLSTSSSVVSSKKADNLLLLLRTIPQRGA